MPDQTVSFSLEVIEQIFHIFISLQINLTQLLIPKILGQVITAGLKLV